jgi:hypothetical protein
MSEEEADKPQRRMVVIIITPVAGVDALTLYDKIKSEIKSTEEYGLEWQETCKVEENKIFTSFTIGELADFHEEVMDYLEMMEDEIAKTHITFQAVME